MIDAAHYTHVEMRMLSIRPGITDPASIVFSDEGEILKDSADPDLLYNQIIRPWKSRLALAYIDHRGFSIDLWLIVLTVLVVIHKQGHRRRLELCSRAGRSIRLSSAWRRAGAALAYRTPGARIVAQHM